jgi:hypothetical protein
MSNIVLSEVVSAAQIIEEIKALPPEERAQVVDFVNEINKHPQVRYMSERSFSRRRMRCSSIMAGCFADWSSMIAKRLEIVLF